MSEGEEELNVGAVRLEEVASAANVSVFRQVGVSCLVMYFFRV